MQKRKTRKNFGPMLRNTQKNWTHAKNLGPRKMLTHVKNILTRVTHATHVKILATQPTQPTHPRNPCYHATHAI